MAYGAVGSLSGAASGFVAFKSGYALVSITTTAIAGPAVAGVGRLGFFAFAAYSAAMNFKNFNDAARYKTELDILETLRKNFQTTMENLKMAITEQSEASNKVQTALNSIASHSASLSNGIRFMLPTKIREKLNNEMLRILQ